VDSDKFDRLSRLLAARPSRRAALRAFGAVALGGAVAAPGREAAAACADPGSNDRCNRDNDCCGDDVRCRGNRCECRSGYRSCREDGRDRCVARRDNPDHCGGCNKRCRNDEECDGDRCVKADEDRCVVGGRCGVGRPPCCAGLACRAGQPELGLGGCVVA
jgi:hypothetical protein